MRLGDKVPVGTVRLRARVAAWETAEIVQREKGADSLGSVQGAISNSIAPLDAAETAPPDGPRSGLFSYNQESEQFC